MQRCLPAEAHPWGWSERGERERERVMNKIQCNSEHIHVHDLHNNMIIVFTTHTHRGLIVTDWPQPHTHLDAHAHNDALCGMECND